MSIRHTRRSFLKKGMALAGASMAAAHWRGPYVLAAPEPGAKLGVAVVGAGGMGGYSLGCALNERLVALVDVDENIIAGAMKEVQNRTKDKAPSPKVFYDYRKMLDECHKDLDAVLIATPDHNHAPAAIRAINLGKATFAQKPLAHNIRECYVLAKAAKEKKVPTQMGNQGHCGEGIRRLVECIWAGAVGNVKESHTILGRNFGGTGGRPPSKPVPKGLHWDEWLGPAPYRDYHDGLHTFSWRSWRDFGTGTIGDMACHHLDGPFWALKLGEAKQFTVECVTQKGGSEEMYTQDNVLRWEFPARGDMPPVKVYAYDHDGLMPDSHEGRRAGEQTQVRRVHALRRRQGAHRQRRPHPPRGQAPAVHRAAQVAPRATGRRAGRRAVPRHPQRRHVLLQLHRLGRPAVRVRAHRPAGGVSPASARSSSGTSRR